MSEPNANPGNDQPTNDTNTGVGADGGKPDTGAATDNVDVSELIAERDKWKHFAQKHENSWKSASKELEKLKQSQMTEAEKAIEAAKAEARQATLAELGAKLTASELAAEAAKAGVTLPDPTFINMAALMNDGEPNAEAIKRFVSALPKANAPAFDPDVLKTSGNHEANKPRQLTRADLQRMTNEEIDAARRAGQLNDLLGIQ